MDKKIIIANWKMSPGSLAEARDILNFTDEYLKSLPRDLPLEIIFCPPFVYTEEVAKMIKTSALAKFSVLGSQDISRGEGGPWTGEVSGPMLKRLGVEYVIIGHSERRWKMAETDEVVNVKLKIALSQSLVPIVCLGETERNGIAKKFLQVQTEKTFDGVSPEDISKCLIAYEPVWAISTSPDAEPDTPDNALESIELIQAALNSKFPASPAGRQVPSFKFLYGGSVTAENAGDFLSAPGIDGVLVGAASVKKDEFVKILSQA